MTPRTLELGPSETRPIVSPAPMRQKRGLYAGRRACQAARPSPPTPPSAPTSISAPPRHSERGEAPRVVSKLSCARPPAGVTLCV